MSKYRDQLEHEGYLVVRGLIQGNTIESLLHASKRAIELGRDGKWPYVRIVGKQFPPWDADGPDIWGIQHIMDPALGEPSFSEFYASDALLDVVCELLECDANEICLELFNLLINPRTDWDLAWHRDDVKWDASTEEERERLKIKMGGCQWNLALLPESCLIVVPGSHLRFRTKQERNASPYEKLDGELHVMLHPGDIVFYNNNILHRAVYPASVSRATLHGSHGRVGQNLERANNILQHGNGWIRDVHWSGKLEKMRQNLENVGEWQGGYSHPGDHLNGLVS